MTNFSAAKSSTIRELRWFGCTLGCIFVAVGAALLWKGHGWGAGLILFGLLVVFAFFLQWPGTRTFYATWMRIAMRMGQVMTLLLLTVLYLGVLTPIALLARLCGQRFLDRRFRSTAVSYWQTCRPDPPGEQDLKQY